MKSYTISCNLQYNLTQNRIRHLTFEPNNSCWWQSIKLALHESVIAGKDGHILHCSQYLGFNWKRSISAVNWLKKNSASPQLEFLYETK